MKTMAEEEGDTNTGTSLVDFEDFFAFPKMFYKVLGMNPYKDVNEEIHNTKKLLGSILFYTAFININWTLFSEIVYMRKSSILELTATFPCFLFTLLSQMKIFIIWLNRKNVNNIIRLMKQQFPKTTNEQEAFDVVNALRSILRLENLYIVILQLGVWCFNLLYLAWSITEYLLDSSNGFAMRFPYYKWYPFKVDDMGIYLLAYVQQIHVGVIAANCFISADIFLFSVISVLLMNFRYIQKQLGIMVLRGNNEDLVKLKMIINFHQITLSMAELTNMAFSTTLLLNFMSSIMIICMAAFQTTAEDVPVIQIVSFLGFLSHELVQTGAICYLGQKLIDYVSLLRVFVCMIFNLPKEFGSFRCSLQSPMVQRKCSLSENDDFNVKEVQQTVLLDCSRVFVGFIGMFRKGLLISFSIEKM